MLHYQDVVKNRGRMSTYEKWQKKLNFTNIEWPVTIPDIEVFERNNPNLAVNVFAYHKKQQHEQNWPPPMSPF